MHDIMIDSLQSLKWAIVAEVVLQGFPPQGLAQVIPQMLAPDAAASWLNLRAVWASLG